MTIRKFLAGSWTLVILGLCWLPRSYMPVRERGPRPFFVPNLDKLVHLGIFAVFAFLWMRGRPRPPASGPPEFSSPAWPWPIISELGQELPVVSRDASVMDGVADVLGVALGIVGYRPGSDDSERRPASPRSEAGGRQV